MTHPSVAALIIERKIDAEAAYKDLVDWMLGQEQGETGEIEMAA
jgi:hypothetical protein